MKIEDDASTEADDETPTRAAIAAHEAGHAVAAWALSCPVERMWIEGDGGGISIDATGLSWTDQVAVCRAGACGTEILGIFAPSWMARRDQKEVMCKILVGLSDREVEDRLRRGGVRAYQFLEANRTLLKKVADALEQAGTLDGAEFSRLAAKYGATPFAPV